MPQPDPTEQVLKAIVKNLRAFCDDLERLGVKTSTSISYTTPVTAKPNGREPYTGTAEDLARREQMSLKDAENFIALLNEPGKPETKLMKITEVAQELQLSRGKVYDMIVKGELPSMTIGKSRRVVRSELDAWLAEASQR